MGLEIRKLRKRKVYHQKVCQNATVLHWGIQLLLTQVKMEYDKISPSTTFFLLEVKAFSVMQFPGARIFFDFKGLEGIGCCLQRREKREFLISSHMNSCRQNSKWWSPSVETFFNVGRAELRRRWSFCGGGSGRAERVAAAADFMNNFSASLRYYS